MNNKIIEFLKRPYSLLVWALICGCAYFVLVGQFVLKFTNTAAGGGMIMWVFLPAIICGAALVLVKTVKHEIEIENNKALLLLFYTHLVIIAMSIVFLIANFA